MCQLCYNKSAAVGIVFKFLNKTVDGGYYSFWYYINTYKVIILSATYYNKKIFYITQYQ